LRRTAIHKLVGRLPHLAAPVGLVI